MSEVAPLTEAAKLSRLLFLARDDLEMFADIFDKLDGVDPEKNGAVRRLIAEIDEFRSDQGWQPFSYGWEANRTGGHGKHAKPYEVCTYCTDRPSGECTCEFRCASDMCGRKEKT